MIYQSLNIQNYNEEEIVISGYGRMFYEVKPFEEIIKVIKDIKRIDISKLDGIVLEFDKLLHDYQHITKMSDRKINKLYVLFNRQINKLQDIING